MGKKVVIIYASISGNTELVCETVAGILKENEVETVLKRAETASIEDIRENSYFILATSTWEHGEMNPFFDSLFEEIQKEDLTKKYSGFIGCGDNRYEPVFFNEGIKIIEQTFVKNNGIKLHTLLLINKSPYPYLNTTVKDWAFKFIEELNKINE